MILFMLTSLGAYFNTVASVSRLLWQFCTLKLKPEDSNFCKQTLINTIAKDRGLPLSRFFTRVCSLTITPCTVMYDLRLTLP
jgi:hypothetical protein